MGANALFEPDVVQAPKLTEVEKRIVSYISRASDGFTEGDILKNVVGRRSSKIDGIRNLLSLDILDINGLGGRKDPYRYNLKNPHCENASFYIPTSDALSPEDLSALSSWLGLLMQMRSGQKDSQVDDNRTSNKLDNSSGKV
jgi:hypothetical protein